MDFLQGLLDDDGVSGDPSDAMRKLIDSIQFLSKYMEIDAVEALNRFLLGLGKIEQVPDWMEEALAGLDLGTQEGQEALHDLLGEWAERLNEGSLEIGDLAEEDVRSMMDFLQSIADGDFETSELNELSVRRSITDVQANAVILLLEQVVFWQREMARKMGVEGDFVAPVIAVDPEKNTEDERDAIPDYHEPDPENDDPGWIGIVKDPFTGEGDEEEDENAPEATASVSGAARVVNMVVEAAQAEINFDPSQVMEGINMDKNYNVQIGDIHASSKLDPDDQNDICRAPAGALQIS